MTDSVLASWADAIDNTQEDGADVNSALIDSDNDVSSDKASSDSSDPEAAFLADADFAVAVARAAELSGLTVIGSTIVDPNIQREKGRWAVLVRYTQVHKCVNFIKISRTVAEIMHLMVFKMAALCHL